MKKLKFLIVDDSLIVRNAVHKAVKEGLGSDFIFEAADGLEAIKILEKESIDIILSDWEMPNLNGEELIFHVRNTPELKDLPFIMMSMHAERDFIITAIQNGVTNYIVKPFSPVELEEIIRRSWKSVKQRTEKQHALPDHQMYIKKGEKSLLAQLVDISRTSAVIRIEYNEEIRLFEDYEIFLQVNIKQKAPIIISRLYARAVRIETESSFHPTSKTCFVRLYFAEGVRDKETEKDLSNLLTCLKSSAEDVIKDD